MESRETIEKTPHPYCFPPPDEAETLRRADALHKLASALNHQFGNSLNIILGLAELLEDDSCSADERRELLAKLIAAAQTGTDKLQWIRGPGISPLNTYSMDLANGLRRLVPLLRQKVDDWSTAQSEPAAARALFQQRDWIVFQVSDQGIGMSPEHLDKLFEAFSPACSLISSRYGGTGLGLAISSKFVQLMGGAISVKSAHGAGSTFTVRIPA